MLENCDTLAEFYSGGMETMSLKFSKTKKIYLNSI